MSIGYVGRRRNTDKRMLVWNQLAGNLELGTNGGTKMTIDSTGNVGVKTTSPATDLHINGHAWDGNAAVRVESTKASIELRSTDASSATYLVHSGSHGTGGGLGFYSRLADDSGWTATPTLLLTADDLVGVGTTNPTEKGEVNGQIKGTGICIGSECKTSWPSTTTDGDWLVSGNDMSSNVSGNVGVGTATPAQKLDVNGNIKGTQLCIGADCRSSWPASAGAGDTDWALSGSNMYSNVSGNVGIGTTTPGEKLHVSGGRILWDHGYYLQQKNSVGTAYNIFGISGNQLLIGGIDASSPITPITFYQSGTEKVRIDGKGNVGIGTRTPDSKLDVNGALEGGR